MYGNPHPMSGNLHQFKHLFVPSQYPEICWNMNPVVEEQGCQQNQNHEHMQHENIAEQHQQPDDLNIDVEEAESMVLVPRDNSGSSVSMVGNNHIIINFMRHLEWPTVHLDVLGKTVLGLVIPPDMQWAKILDHLMPKLLSATVPLSLQLSPSSQVKRYWLEAFATKDITMLHASSILATIVVQRKKCPPRRRSVIPIWSHWRQGWMNLHGWCNSLQALLQSGAREEGSLLFPWFS
jgi:hypothetical protein